MKFIILGDFLTLLNVIALPCDNINFMHKLK